MSFFAKIQNFSYLCGLKVKKMKKILIPVLVFVIGFTLSAQNRRLPSDLRSTIERATTIVDFYKKLDTVLFVTDQEWTVEGHGITQIWSDAVRVPACDTISAFRGGGVYRTHADPDSGTVVAFFYPACRSNFPFSNTLFPWEAVNVFGPVLCPLPWRVPTVEDFCNLNKILFNHNRCYSHKVTPEQVTEKFVDLLGGVFSGASGGSRNERLFFHDVKTYYWSQNEYDTDYAFHFTIDVHGNVQPRSLLSGKLLGFSLRCVRDGEIK